MLRSKKGFTLIELMIVVAIIGILAAIAIPNFLRFQAKSKQSEAKTNLKAIYTAETSYFGENNSYNTFQIINWSPVGTSRYRYTLSNAVNANDLGNLTGVTTFDGWGSGATPAWTTNAFSAGAQGNVDNDTALDVWSITDGNVLTNGFNDV
ncbi:MAG: prepilin-type N-terminal cleavage/methylation domain-containing protein [Deltaproteobacteria bacterium]|nr:prepilin-type N-terminal cleavage/methylation domain-containing protein [Deltaproteobacteria bacterium]